MIHLTSSVQPMSCTSQFRIDEIGLYLKHNAFPHPAFVHFLVRIQGVDHESDTSNQIRSCCVTNTMKDSNDTCETSNMVRSTDLRVNFWCDIDKSKKKSLLVRGTDIRTRVWLGTTACLLRSQTLGRHRCEKAHSGSGRKVGFEY